MGENPSRRALLRAMPPASLALLAGCSSITSSFTGPPPDVVVFNRTGSTVEATIEVTDQSSGETVLSDTASIDPGAAAEYPDALPASGEFAATVQANDQLSGNHEWTVSSEDQSLQVQIQSESVDFGTVSP